MERLTRPAAFLDRDGTINVQPPRHEYVTRIEDLQVLPGAIEGMVHLAVCGFVLVVVSNQRGVGRGLIHPECLVEIEDAFQEELEPRGVRISGFYYCPHLIADKCECRKPKPGLLLDAADKLNLDLGRSWMIGDSISDIRAGAAAGCRTAYVGRNNPPDRADVASASLEQAADVICDEGSIASTGRN